MDETEQARREMINAGQPGADLTEAQVEHQETWTTQELQRDFEVIGFMAPYTVAMRKSDGAPGSLMFATGSDGNRYYFGWAAK